jgi:hypothetical protein
MSSGCRLQADGLVEVIQSAEDDAGEVAFEAAERFGG